MKQFTVITKKSVWRYAAKSVQALTRQLAKDGIEYLAIHEDKESQTT